MSKSRLSNNLLLALCIVILQSGLSSCNVKTDGKASLEVFEYIDSVRIIPSPKSVDPNELFNGKVHLGLGKIQSYEGKDKAEKNLLSQIATNNSALLHGDKENCVNYLYKDAIVYFRKYYPGFSDEAITDEFFKTMSQSYMEQLNRLSERGIDFSLVIPNFVRKIRQGDNVFIVFNVTSNVCSETLFTHFADYEQNLGISHNGGKNWCFITINEDTPNILRISNSEEIINAVMDY